MAQANPPQAAQPKDEIGTGIAAAATPQVGPASGPRVRFCRPFGQWTVGAVTDRFPVESVVRLKAEGWIEVVDPAEFSQFKSVADKKAAEAQAQRDSLARKERQYREDQERAIKGSDRAIKPNEAVTR